MKFMRKFLWFTAAVCCSLLLTSCVGTEDNPTGGVDNGESSSSEQLKARIFSQVGGLSLDTCMATPIGIIKGYDIREDGSYESLWYVHTDNNGDCVMDPEEYDILTIEGKWEPLEKVYCPFLDETYDAMAVTFNVKSIEKPDIDEKELDSDLYSDYDFEFSCQDTIYIIPSKVKGVVFVSQLDFSLMALVNDYVDPAQMFIGEAMARAITRADNEKPFDFFDLLREQQEERDKALTELAKRKLEGMKQFQENFMKGVRLLGEAAQDVGHWFTKTVLNSYPCLITGKSDWMATTFKGLNPKVREISLPGSHDSFTYAFGKVEGNWASTQVYNFKEQLDAGLRFFDMRINRLTAINKLHFYHLIPTHVTFTSALDELKDFFHDHPGETVVLTINFDGDANQSIVDQLKSNLADYKDIFVDYAKYGPDIRLNDAKGKAILIQRFYPNKNSASEKWTNGYVGIEAHTGSKNEVSEMTYSDGTKKVAYGKIMEQDLYENDVQGKSSSQKIGITNSFFDYKKKLMKENFETAANPTEDHMWFINKSSSYTKYTILGKIPGLAYAENATVMNKFAADYINDHLGQKTGFVVMDYAATDQEGGTITHNVYGDALVNAILANNVEMVKKGILK